MTNTIRPGNSALLWTAIAVLFVALAGSVSPASSGRTVTVEADSVAVRSGAGNYYEIIARLPQGARLEVIEETDGWYRVALPDRKAGYVSAASLTRKTASRGRFRYDAGDEGVGRVAASEIMAATKGITNLGTFGKRYADKRDLDTRAFEALEEIPFSPAEFAAFRKELRRKRVRLSGLSGEGILPSDREIGSAIALRLSAAGMSADGALRKYVSLVGFALLETTPLYDEPFVFIVLDSPKIESFAVPGGYVFITTGAIARMKSEAELAGVLGHEIIHVVQRHGIRELEKQRTRIESQKMMGSLDEELNRLSMDRGDEELMAEMEETADQLFEILIGGRKRESEDESDRYGTAVLASAGYAAGGLKSFLSSIETSEGAERNPVYSHRTIGDRVSVINAAMKEFRLSEKDGARLDARFRTSVGK